MIAALWFGSALFLLFAAAPAAFRAAGSPSEAANVVGAMLVRWHYLALIAPVVLLLTEWRRARTWVIVLLFAAVICATAQGLADLRIRQIRASSPVPVSELPRGSALRRRFSLLHAVSSVLLLLQAVAAAGAVAADPRPMPPAPRDSEALEP